MTSIDFVDYVLLPGVIAIIIVYLYCVYRLGPRLMKNKPAYNLKKFMIFYNAIQVFACFYFNAKIWNLTSWTLFDFTKCIEYLPNQPNSEIFENIIYKLWLLKIFDLSDTVIFILRKKQNQITYLHTFHHSSTITLCYIVLRFYRGQGAFFSAFLNNYVHVIMYTYYFFANICSAETMKKYIFIKKSVTIIQMVQFCLILAHTCIMSSYCDIHVLVKGYFLLVVSVIFYGFYDFYKKAYSNKTDKKLKYNSK